MAEFDPSKAFDVEGEAVASAKEAAHPFAKAPWYSVYQEIKNNPVPLAGEPEDPKEKDKFYAITAKQVYEQQKVRKDSNHYSDAIDRQGGWGLSPEMRNVLGADDTPNDPNAGIVSQAIKPVRNLLPNVADAALRGYQGVMAGVEGTALVGDDLIKRTGLSDLSQKYLGVPFEPGHGLLALMEAFPEGGLSHGMGTALTPKGSRLSPEIQARYNTEAAELFNRGANKEQMNAWAKDRGLNQYGDDLDAAIQARDADRAPQSLPEGIDPNSAVDAIKNLRGVAEEAENFKGTPDPKQTDLFPTDASRASDAEAWGEKLGAPKPVEEVAAAPEAAAVPETPVEPTISKKEADALFKKEVGPAPKVQSVGEWEAGLKKQAEAFKAKEADPSGAPSEPVPAPKPVDPKDPAAPAPALRTDVPEPTPHTEVVSKLTEALNQAGKLSKDQKALYREARSQRLKGVLAARNGTAGEAGFRAELAKLKGELPKVEFEGVRNQFKQEDVDGLFDHLRNNRSLSTFDQINARQGLGKLLDGQVPTPKELDLLGRVYPKDFVQAAMKHRSGSNKIMDFIGNAVNLPRSMMSTLDMSAPFRQGLFLVGRKEFWKGFQSMFKQFGSEKAYNAVMDDIRGRQTYPLMEESGLALTDMGTDLLAREEAFASQWAERIPVYGKAVQASGRAYSGFLNKVRADTFDTLVRKSYDAGISFDKDPKALKDIAKFVNSATGRGDLGSHINQAGPMLNAVFFSPRLIASRVNLLNPAYYATLSPVVRKEALKSLLSLGAIATTVTSLAAAGGASVEVDPRSSDFAKIKTGNTRFDILGGFGQYLTLGARLATNQSMNAKGEVQELGKKFGSKTRLDVGMSFLMNKESPVASYVTDFLRGKNAIGEPFNAGPDLVKRFVPLILSDLDELFTDPNSAGPAAIVPSAFGVGTQTYDASKKPTDGNKFDPKAAFEEEKPTTEEPVPEFDPSKPFDATTEGNAVATDTLSEIGVKITDKGVRSHAQQEKYYKTASGVAKPGTSKHEEGNAVDIAIPEYLQPEDIEQVLADKGFVGVRVVTKRHGTGPHWHIQWDEFANA
jgi:hypothetical protein